MTPISRDQKDLEIILITIFCFVDDLLKVIFNSLLPAIKAPNQHCPPPKHFNLRLTELITLGIFISFTGHKNWKDYYKHLYTYHLNDFPKLPAYQNFVADMNKVSPLAFIILQGFANVFKAYTPVNWLKFADSPPLQVCKIKREFTHKVCKGIASKSKSSMGWFYGFKLHIICNQLMEILEFRITTGATDDRKGLDMMWNHIFGMIIADAGYVGKNWQAKARSKGKILFTAVKVKMKKLMTNFQHQLLNLRETVETVLSVLKYRLGMESSLPRSPLGHLSHYLWCLLAYQFKRFLINRFAISVPRLT
jgi:transposase